MQRVAGPEGRIELARFHALERAARDAEERAPDEVDPSGPQGWGDAWTSREDWVGGGRPHAAARPRPHLGEAIG